MPAPVQIPTQLQVLLHREVRKQLPRLRHLYKPEPDDALRGQVMNRSSLEENFPFRWPMEAAYGSKQSALSGSIGADQSNYLPLRHVEAYASKNLDGTISS